MKQNDIVDFVLKVEEISKVGLKYSKDPYAIDNYNELQDYAHQFITDNMQIPLNKPNFFSKDIYPTPNVSVRTVIFDETRTKVLLVQERLDKGWSLPGGWTELTLSPKESALKELREEAGAECKIKRLVGIFDRYEGVPTTGIPEYIIVFEGEILSEKVEVCHEIIQKKYFPLDDLPNWSVKHNPDQVIKMIEAAKKGETLFD